MVNVRLTRLLFFVPLLFTAGAFAQKRTVDWYILQAGTNSPQFIDLGNQLAMSKLDSALIRTNYRPKVGFNTTGTYAPVVRGFGYDEALSNGKTFSSLVTVNQALLGKNRFNNELTGLRLTTDSVQNTVLLAQQQLKRDIISQYITAYSSQQQLEADNKIYQLLKYQELVLKKLTQNNVYKQADYLAFLVTLQQEELQMKQNKFSWLNDLGNLNTLSGINNLDSVQLAEPRLTTAPAHPVSGIFLKQYQLDSLRIENNKKVIALNYTPRVGVYADGGYNSSFINNSYKNFGISAGITVAVPIYDGHQRKLQERKLTVQENTRMAYKNFYSQQNSLQLALLNQQLAQAEELFKSITEQVKFTESLISVDGKLLQTGDIAISDYILAIRNYLDLQNTLRQTTINRLALINQVNYWNN